MSFLSPTIDLPDSEGNRSDNLNPSPIGYGKTIRRVYGVKRITTTPLVQLPIVETVHEEKVEAGGKGGGGTSQTQTSYTYSGTFAVMIQDTPIAGVRRIWMNNKLFYENKPFMSGDILRAQEIAATKFKIYYGTNTQTQDPILNTRFSGQNPAYRGRAYIVFNNIELAELGNRIPSVDVEVVENGVGSNDSVVYPYPTPLSRIIGQLCLRSGLKPTEFDVGQLTDRVQGYSVDTSAKADKLIRDLGELYHFYPRDDGDKLVFEKQPTPLSRDEHEVNCVINEDGYVVNAYHEVLGRQGYFPPEAGTSEGQFLVLRSMLLAYKVTNDPEYLDVALNLTRPLTSMYSTDVPTDLDFLYIPHWLFVVKNPVIAQSNVLNYKATLTLVGDEYKVTIPEGFPDHGTEIVKITNAYPDDGGFVSWDNPFAGLIGTTPLGPATRLVSNPTNTEAYFSTDAYLNPPATLDVNLMVIYNFGEWLDTSQNMEAWPHWRPMERNEINCAVDTLPWALECFELLAELNPDPKWDRAVTLTKNTIDKVFDVDDGRNWITPTLGGPLSLSGSYIDGARPGWDISRLTRNERQELVIEIPAGYGECQYGRGLSDKIKLADTGVYIKANFNNQSNVTVQVDLFVQSGTNILSATRYIRSIYVLPNTLLELDEEIPLEEFFGETYNVKGDVTVSPVGGIPSQTQIDVVGFTLEKTMDDKMVVDFIEYRIRPEVQLPYTPGAAPFTANAFSNALIDWRGAPGIGYQDPMTWVNNPNPGNLERMLDFIQDSQVEYTSRYGAVGPFMPSYVWDRFDRQQVTTDPADTWTFDWVDPNTQWVGYTARVVAMTAEAGNKSNNTRAKLLANNFLEWLEGAWTDPNKFIPTNFPETIEVITRNEQVFEGHIGTVYNGFVYKCIDRGFTNPTVEPIWPTTLNQTVSDGGVVWQCVGYTYGTIPCYSDYDEPHAASLFMRAAAYIYDSGYETTKSMALIQRCWTYLERLWGDTTGDVIGTWSHFPQGEEWFGFWSGEIMTILSLFLGDLSSVRAAAGISATTVRSRMDTHRVWLQDRTRRIVNEDLEDLFIGNNYTISRTKETDLPRKVEVVYYSSSLNGDTDIRSLERRSSRSEDVVTLETGVVMDGNEALRLAYLRMSQEYTQRVELDARLLIQTIRPGDVKEFNIEGQPIRLQFTEVDLKPEGFSKIKAVAFDASAFNYQVRASGDPLLSSSVDTLSATIPFILDIPNYTDSTEPGYYTYLVPTKNNWFGGGLYTSLDDNNYIKEADYVSIPSYGSVTTPMLDKKSTLIDYESVMVVAMANGSLSSVSEAEFRLGVNAALVGSEIIYFKNAVLVSGDTYEISTIMRGRRGTYTSMLGHAPAEQFVLLDAAIQSADIPQALIGVDRFYKGVTNGQSIGDIPPEEFKTLSVRSRPLEPAHLRGYRISSGIDLTWLRRSRFRAEWQDGVDAPLEDSSLEFVVELLTAINGDILKSISVTESRYLITNQDLIDAYGDSAATAYISVAQVNTVVGKGVISQLQVD